jgi:tetratricopeptide (TPR) repeat protein
VAAAHALHQRGVAETAAGRPAAAARYLHAALRLATTPASAAPAATRPAGAGRPRTGPAGATDPPPAGPAGATPAGAAPAAAAAGGRAGGGAGDLRETTGRVLISLAHAEAEQGRTERGLALLDEAAGLLPAHGRALLLQQRGLLLLRLGRAEDALALLDAAVPLLERSGDPVVLARTLLNRGNLHTYAGRLRLARADLRHCQELAAAHGLDLLAAKALHNLGSCELATGDVPAALDAYQTAAARYAAAGPGFLATVAVDKARALLAAGLAREAGAELDTALEVSQRLRLSQDRAEAELARAHAALAAGDARTARAWAGRAGQRFHRRGNDAWAALAALLRLRAELAESGPTLARAGRCQALADRLAALRLAHDAELARLLAARTLLAVGRRAEAAALLAAPGHRGAPVENLLLRRLVAAELAQAAGNRRVALRQLRTGLAALHDHRGRLGSLDLQSGISALGAELAAAGLAAACAAGSPRLVLTWSERTRAQALRMRPVRPPADQEFRDTLGELRQLSAAVRDAELAGRREPRLRARCTELERRLRERTWQVAGTGESAAVAAPEEIVAELADAGCVLVSLLDRDGRLAGLVIRDGAIRLVELGQAERVREAICRLLSDLDALTGRRLPTRLAQVVRMSFDRQLAVLTEELTSPLRAELGDRPAVLVSVAAVPWGLLPDLRGRPVTTAPSASSWLAARRSRHAWRHRAAGAGQRPAVLVAGPNLAHAEAEVAAIRGIRPSSTTLLAGRATVEATLRALDGAPVAHLAAHGQHQRENVLFSRLELADGPLMAHDLQALASPPGHVVLSACDVGQAVVRPGEEALGFSLALLQAGTATVVASLSRVVDEAAVDLMTAYHRGLVAGAEPAQALAAAGRDGLPVPFVCLGAG